MIETNEKIGVCSVSCYEIALAYKKGRIDLPCPPDEWFKESLTPVNIELLSLTPNIANKAVNLADIHKDPFDRIIIATTIEYKAQLASIEKINQFINKWEYLRENHQELDPLNPLSNEEIFTFYQFEAELHPRIRTTNLIERLFEEFRRKADEIGAFPNEMSCLTLFFLVVQRDHAKHNRPFL